MSFYTSFYRYIGFEAAAYSLLRFCLSFRILAFRFAPPHYWKRRKHCANALLCGAYPCRSPSASPEVEGLLASSPKRHPVMHAQFSRGAIIGTVLFLIAVVVPWPARSVEEMEATHTRLEGCPQPVRHTLWRQSPHRTIKPLTQLSGHAQHRSALWIQPLWFFPFVFAATVMFHF